MHFSRQMAAFVRTGIPITEALEVVEEGSNNKRFRQILATMREQINNGVPFSEALAEHSKVFPPYYIGILKSAELTGQLDVSLEQLSGYIERDLDSQEQDQGRDDLPDGDRRHVAAHRRDPAGVGHAEVRRVLQEPRREAAAADHAAHRRVGAVAVALVRVGDAARRRSSACSRGCTSRQRAGCCATGSSCSVPLVKDVVLFAVTERVCRIVGAMVKAGVPLPETLNAAIQGTNNKVFETGLVDARDRMLEGEGLAEPIADTHLFPARPSQMMRVGENTGTLDIQLENAAEYYGRELEYKLKKLTSLFEPAVIIFMGVIVGFVAVALISAMYGVFNSLEAADVRRRSSEEGGFAARGSGTQGRGKCGTSSVRTDHDKLVERGFTLVELLIVIVILGVLAGIVVFAVGNMTSNAKPPAARPRRRRSATRSRSTRPTPAPTRPRPRPAGARTRPWICSTATPRPRPAFGNAPEDGAGQLHDRRRGEHHRHPGQRAAAAPDPLGSGNAQVAAVG